MHQPYPASPFSRFAKWTAHATGHPLAFLVAVLLILGWAITGPLFGFSDTWQLNQSQGGIYRRALLKGRGTDHADPAGLTLALV